MLIVHVLAYFILRKKKIVHDCTCSQSNLKLECDGFERVENVDPKAMTKTGGVCLIKNGLPFLGLSPFSFV